MMDIDNTLERIAVKKYLRSIKELTPCELDSVLSDFVLDLISERWIEDIKQQRSSKCAFYLSAEYLMGRAALNNLINLNIYEDVKTLLNRYDIDISVLEEVPDQALGNGGLGRLAACFLDSASALSLPVMGHGIKYKFGLFKQSFQDGKQLESADCWQGCGQWSVRRDSEKKLINFNNFSLYAVPYDMPIIPYGEGRINTLRLWQSEAVCDLKFNEFNNMNYIEAIREREEAERISYLLYPNDNGEEGKRLRLRQEYFLASASIQDIICCCKDLSDIDKSATIQLNDTHLVIAIPEFIRLLCERGISFEDAFSAARKVFSYTNHTVMEEALEKWDERLIREELPEIYSIIVRIQQKLRDELMKMQISPERFDIICENTVHMCRLAMYMCHTVNGVSKIHTFILKNKLFSHWGKFFDKKIINITNGITFRRWLIHSNPGLFELRKALNRNENEELKRDTLERFIRIKNTNKEILCDYIYKKERFLADPSSVFDMQIKRIHEYKRQLLNAMSILAIYYRIKRGELKDFQKTLFIFGGKAAPGYDRAKGIIYFINSLAEMINNDNSVNDYMKVLFICDYNVSYAEKLIPAGDVSVQISTAGKEACGTGNMKFMLNGAVTLGTMDGANIEIFERAGKENNYTFGATVEELESISNTYNPVRIYESDPEIMRVVDSISNGLFKDSSGMLSDLKNSLLIDTYNRADCYYTLYDFKNFLETRLKLNKDCMDKELMAKKCLINSAAADIFSSDNAVKTYADLIWNL